MKKDDEVFLYSTDDYGYTDLVKQDSVDSSLIQDFEDMNIPDDDRTKIELLFVLKGVCCGCFNSPFLTDATFQEIVKVVENHKKMD